jgi:subtilisin family serine protease
LKSSLLVAAVLLALSSAGSAATTKPASPAYTEVVVTLAAPPLGSGSGTKDRSLDLHSFSSTSYLERLASAQSDLSQRIEATIPGAKVTWHYRIVANGLAVSLPAGEVALLARVPGVARVFGSYRYRQRETVPTVPPPNVSLIGAPDLWGADLANAGQGVKIGIIDDGIDQTHPFFDPSTFTMPAGFPKGDTAYTTAKVIVARAFPPPRLDYANANLPFDPSYSDHAIHVAGIAAGNAGTSVNLGGQTLSLSGVAPRAYIGNYKALTIPTANFGLDGNSPEIVAAIEAAVSDGMNVINLSLGEPEVDPRNDIVAQALNAASDAGVVVAVAAGNEFGENGAGSLDSPGSAGKAITVAASTDGEGGAPDRIAAFSSSGPTPFGLLLKPDVSAPGVGILSSVPNSEGFWDRESGTSMATPHVAGAAALLRQRHPDWTVAQIKSALVLTGAPVTNSEGREVSPLREGGGRIALRAADQPLVFSSPSSVSFGLLKRSQRLARGIEISDAGGNVGSCQVEVRKFHSTSGAYLRAATSVSVPGTLAVEVSAMAHAAAGDLDGWIVLTCAGQQRRIPFWLRVSVPQLNRKKITEIFHSGVYQGDTRGRTALVNSYRYPERAEGVPTLLSGPEQVFRLRLRSSIQNFGVVVVSHDRGVFVSPRIVRAQSEDRLAGLAALPININPYLDSYAFPEPVAGALKPGPGFYDIVFDTTSAKAAGRFRFRLWINDRSPPRLRFVSRKKGVVTVRITDRGSGVDPSSIAATLGAKTPKVSFDSRTGEAKITVSSAAGSTLIVRASDYQESKNDENAGALLPNTAELRLTI